MKLNQPGEEIRARVPSTAGLHEDEQCFVTIKVLSAGDKRFLDNLTDPNAGLSDFDIARKMFGRFITRFEGFEDQEGNEIRFTREGEKETDPLTQGACAQLIPFIGELADMIKNGARLQRHERKNSE